MRTLLSVYFWISFLPKWLSFDRELSDYRRNQTQVTQGSKAPTVSERQKGSGVIPKSSHIPKAFQSVVSIFHAIWRSSHFLYKMLFLKIFRKTLVPRQSLFFNKVTGRGLQLNEKRDSGTGVAVQGDFNYTYLVGSKDLQLLLLIEFNL